MTGTRMGAARGQTTYGELADIIDNLPLIVREVRRNRRQSIRAAAAEMGIPHTNLARMENGTGDLGSKSLIVVLRWLNRSCFEAIQ